jgi:hypothetical protein
MVGSRKKNDNVAKPTTVLERLGGEPKHVIDAGKKASSRVERKARLRSKTRLATQE